MITKDLQIVFTKAVTYARAHRHEYITIEHIFIYLLQDEAITSLMEQLQIDTDEITEKLKKHIQENTPIYPEDVKNQDPVETVTLTKTIEQMVAHSQLSGKGESTPEEITDLIFSLSSKEVFVR